MAKKTRKRKKLSAAGVLCLFAAVLTLSLFWVDRLLAPLLKNAQLASDWLAFFGGFHPVLLHLPIGGFVVAILLELGSVFSKQRHHRAVLLVLQLSAFFSVLSCLLGVCLAVNGDYSEEYLSDHKRYAIIFTLVAVFASYAKHSILRRSRGALWRWGYVPSLVLGFAALISAGHHGGELTHGSPFKNAPWKSNKKASPKGAEEKQPIVPKVSHDKAKKNDTKVSAHSVKVEKKPARPKKNPLIYEEIVVPILKERCYSCHGVKKQKGELRMDSYAAMLRGGAEGPCLVPGDPVESLLIETIKLPMDDEYRMPPENKPQLTREEVAILEWWVTQGAPRQKRLSQMRASSTIQGWVRKRVK